MDIQQQSASKQNLAAMNVSGSSESISTSQQLMIQDLNQKLLESNNQTNELKIKLMSAQQELDQANKEKAELSNQLKQKEAFSNSSVDQQEVKRL